MENLFTERCRLEPYVKAHIPDILKMFAERDSNRFIAPLQGKTDEEYLIRLNENVIRNQESLQYWSAYHLETNAFVGTLNLNKFGKTELDQVGLHLSRDFWGKGYGYELCKEVVKYGFEVRKLKVLHWVFEMEHEVSKKLAIKLGFEPFKQMIDEDFGCELGIYQLKR